MTDVHKKRRLLLAGVLAAFIAIGAVPMMFVASEHGKWKQATLKVAELHDKAVADVSSRPENGTAGDESPYVLDPAKERSPLMMRTPEEPIAIDEVLKLPMGFSIDTSPLYSVNNVAYPYVGEGEEINEDVWSNYDADIKKHEAAKEAYKKNMEVAASILKAFASPDSTVVDAMKAAGIDPASAPVQPDAEAKLSNIVIDPDCTTVKSLSYLDKWGEPMVSGWYIMSGLLLEDGAPKRYAIAFGIVIEVGTGKTTMNDAYFVTEGL